MSEQVQFDEGSRQDPETDARLENGTTEAASQVPKRLSRRRVAKSVEMAAAFALRIVLHRALHGMKDDKAEVFWSYFHLGKVVAEEEFDENEHDVPLD